MMIGLRNSYKLKHFPMIFYNLGSDLLCCDATQVRKISSNFRQAEGIFGRCRSCMKNMIKSNVYKNIDNRWILFTF